MKIDAILGAIAAVLHPGEFDDVSNNGLQIARAGDDVGKVAFAVDAEGGNHVQIVSLFLLFWEIESLLNRKVAFLGIKRCSVIENRRDSFSVFADHDAPISVVAVVVAKKSINDDLIPKTFGQAINVLQFGILLKMNEKLIDIDQMVIARFVKIDAQCLTHFCEMDIFDRADFEKPFVFAAKVFAGNDEHSVANAQFRFVDRVAKQMIDLTSKVFG